MGIQNLNRLLEFYCPYAIEKVFLTKYSGEKIAIDGNSFIHSAIDLSLGEINKNKMEYKSIYINNLKNSLKLLLNFNIKPIFIFDGSVPKEKNNIIKERKEIKLLEKLTLDKLINETEEFIPKGILNQPRFYKKIKYIDEIKLNNKHLKKLCKNIKINDREVLSIHNHNKKNIYREYLPLFYNFLKDNNIPIIKNKEEAELNIALCVNNGMAKAAMSNDMDSLVYGAPIFLSKIEEFLKTGIIYEYKLGNILFDLLLTYDQFIDLCVLMGCDYSNISLHYYDALEIIDKYKNLENFHEKCPSQLSKLQLNSAICAREIFKKGSQISDMIKKDLFDSYKK